MSTGRLVPMVITPLAVDEAARAIARAFAELEGRQPTPRELAMLKAHSALETGQWKKMSNWNPGMVTTPNRSRDYFQMPGNPLFFVSYSSVDDGFRDWESELKRNWPDAWSVLDGGNPHEYSLGLLHGRLGSYMGGEKEFPNYDAGIARLYTQFEPTGGEETAPLEDEDGGSCG